MMATSTTSTDSTILDVVIVGGGLSGTFIGYGLGNQLDWRLLEASNRLGGRLLNADNTTVDMGGAWIWPKFQPHMRELVSKLSATTFVQPGDVDSMRIVGGAVQLVERLHRIIQEQNRCDGVDRIRLNSPVKSCKLLDGHGFPNQRQPVVQLETTNGDVVLARKVVFAVPPKLLSTSVSFEPLLSNSKQAAMASSHTWMAGVTKVALVYGNRFWSPDSSYTGLSSSSSGPAFQVYDGGPSDNSMSALTFFSHIPPKSPAQENDGLLAQQVADQMVSYWTQRGLPSFAAQARSYTSFHVYRWPHNAYISGADSKPDCIHPHPSPTRDLSTPEWNGALLFAGTETDLVSPGVMEGAVGAAKRTLEHLLREELFSALHCQIVD